MVHELRIVPQVFGDDDADEIATPAVTDADAPAPSAAPSAAAVSMATTAPGDDGGSKQSGDVATQPHVEAQSNTGTPVDSTTLTPPPVSDAAPKVPGTTSTTDDHAVEV